MKVRENVDLPGTLSNSHSSLGVESVFSRFMNCGVVSTLKKHFAGTLLMFRLLKWNRKRGYDKGGL
jgi:hypothetical protein